MTAVGLDWISSIRLRKLCFEEGEQTILQPLGALEKRAHRQRFIR
jgi:hypothetical protein